MGPERAKSDVSRPDLPGVNGLRVSKIWARAPYYADADTWEEDSEGDPNVGAVASRHEAPPRVLDAHGCPLSHSSDRAGTEKQLRESESIRLRTCDMSSVFGWSWFGKPD